MAVLRIFVYNAADKNNTVVAGANRETLTDINTFSNNRKIM